ncbi:MAG: serine/threonine-protein phosphatase [Anaerolineae bacterium]|nr:serine/threonine-protein phosphatase [Anaerolineae bacterium]MCK4470497.1 serine/threonine-protein phosphatase [Anaerolineae bacterium]
METNMEIEVAAAKVGKWATSESGDTLEMIERPHGGFSFVLVDGQRSGRAAKAISNLVARKAISELAEGVRDGAAARAAHDYLYTHKGGQVSATLNILSVDLTSNTLVLSRNSHCPTIIITPESRLQLLDAPSEPVGVRHGIKPQVTELPLTAGTMVVVYTDGLEMAGARSSRVFDVPAAVRELTAGGDVSAHQLADSLLGQALALDEGRPRDDVSVLVLRVVDHIGDGVRRLAVRLPL